MYQITSLHVVSAYASGQRPRAFWAVRRGWRGTEAPSPGTGGPSPGLPQEEDGRPPGGESRPHRAPSRLTSGHLFNQLTYLLYSTLYTVLCTTRVKIPSRFSEIKSFDV